MIAEIVGTIVGSLFITLLVVIAVGILPAILVGWLVLEAWRTYRHRVQPVLNRAFRDREAPLLDPRLAETPEEREARHKRLGIGSYGIRAAKEEDRTRA